VTNPQDHIRHLERIKAWLLGKEYYKAVEALVFASKHHTGMRKDRVTPEFHHQISISLYLRTLPNLRYPEEVIATAMLHDVIEDENVSPQELESLFGPMIAEAVLLLSKEVKGIKKSVPDYYDAMRGNPIASIVKGGDRIHNFQTMHSVFTCEKQTRYIEECEEFILPMLREARNRFPDQVLAYENIKHALNGQIELLRLTIESKQQILELKLLGGKNVQGDNPKGS
jgi:(p)ppGpp synthase/HD superfamily hydrolase